MRTPGFPRPEFPLVTQLSIKLPKAKCPEINYLGTSNAEAKYARLNSTKQNVLELKLLKLNLLKLKLLKLNVIKLHVLRQKSKPNELMQNVLKLND